jgi:hypothetical protein
MKKIFLSAFLFSLFLIACETTTPPDLQPLRLLKYNIPFTILAPDSVKVEQEDLIVQKGVTFRNDAERYFVQLWIREASSGDLAKIKKEELEEVKKDPYFSGLVEEEEEGFIFKKQIDSTHTNYDFRHIKTQGDKEYIFQTGFIGTYTEEEVKSMYEAVKGE